MEPKNAIILLLALLPIPYRETHGSHHEAGDAQAVGILYPCLVKEAGNSYLSPWASAFFRKHCKDTKFLGIYIALSPKK